MVGNALASAGKNTLYLYGMKITFLTAGKTHEKAIAELTAKYVKRIKGYCSFQWIETADIKSREPAVLAKKEGALFLEHIAKGDLVILLDEKGESFTSAAFAGFIQQKQAENRKHIIFLCGGAYGFSDEIYNIAGAKICLSKMTFPHQMVRLIFSEQLYRAFTIINNEPYHH